jgi:hypothetical protein
MKKIITSALLIIGLSGAAFSSTLPPAPNVGNLHALPPAPNVGNFHCVLPPAPNVGNIR